MLVSQASARTVPLRQGVGPAFLLHWPMRSRTRSPKRVRASSPRHSKGAGLALDGSQISTHMDLGSNLGPDVTMIMGDHIGHSDQYGTSGRMALGHQHSLKWQLTPQASTWSLMLRGTMDIHTDRSYDKATDPDMASAAAWA